MLGEIRMRGLGVIEDAVLELAPGLTVVSGETGAGKTMVVTGLGLLLGSRADAGWVRAGADQAVVEGRVVIDPSAIVERSLVRGPAVIGPQVRVRDAYVGPYTAIGAGTVIENTEIEHALLLRDVTIRDVSWRLERSIVGERARIARTFRLPQAINLCLGEDAEICVS